MCSADDRVYPLLCTPPRSHQRHSHPISSLTTAACHEALALNTLVIISYHSSLSSPSRPRTPTRRPFSAAPAYSPHTALDAVWGGVNCWLAAIIQAGKKHGQHRPRWRKNVRECNRLREVDRAACCCPGYAEGRTKRQPWLEHCTWRLYCFLGVILIANSMHSAVQVGYSTPPDATSTPFYIVRALTGPCAWARRQMREMMHARSPRPFRLYTPLGIVQHEGVAAPAARTHGVICTSPTFARLSIIS